MVVCKVVKDFLVQNYLIYQHIMGLLHSSRKTLCIYFHLIISDTKENYISYNLCSDAPLGL